MAAIHAVCHILAPSKWDKMGVLRSMAVSYAAGFMKHGLRPVFADMDDPRFAERLAALARDPEVRAIYSVASWGVDTQLAQGAKKHNVLAASGKPFIGHHGD